MRGDSEEKAGQLLKSETSYLFTHCDNKLIIYTHTAINLLLIDWLLFIIVDYFQVEKKSKHLYFSFSLSNC